MTAWHRSARVRVNAAEVAADRFILRGEVVGRRASDAAPASIRLLLRRRGSSEELEVQAGAGGTEAEFSAAVDAASLVTDEGAAVWEVLGGPVDATGGVVASGVEPALDTALIPSVVLRRGDDLHRVRLRAARGELTLAVDLLPPHAEVQQVVVEDDALVVDAVVHRVADPSPDATALVVARSRDRKVEVEFPAALEGRTVHARLALGALAADVPGTEYWDLSVRSEAFGTLRIGGHLDDVRDKKHAIVFPARTVPSAGEGRSLQPYFTIHGNLSVRSRPLLPAGSKAPDRVSSATGGRGDSIRTAGARIALHAVRFLARLLARTVIRRFPSRRPVAPVRDGRPHVSILIIHGYGMGGTVRTVFNQAAQLSPTYDVEIVSQIRAREEPFFRLPPRVPMIPLDDRTDAGRTPGLRGLVRDRLAGLPSLLVHEADNTFAQCTLWTDVQLVRRLRAQQGGILMATRPSLNLLIAQLAAPGVITVGQEHMNFAQKRPELARDLLRAYRRLDALTVLTRGDLEDYSRALEGSGTRIVRVPNAVTALTGGLADPASRIVVAVGRLTHQKGFDRLIRAFEQVVREHPDWTLRIYGSGPHRARLQKLILDRDLYNNVRLMGRAERMGEELAKASILAMSSRFEGFPMVLLEGMSKGLAVVSFDCPRGPGDLITSGVDGLLVPEGDVDGLARGLLRLVEDEDLRRRFGAAALRTVGQYDAESIGRQWDELLTGLLAERSPRWWPPAAPRPARGGLPGR